MILFVQSHEFKNVNRGAEGVYRSHGNGFEVIAKRGASADRAGVALESGLLLARSQVPQFDRLVPTPRGQHPAIRAVGQ